MFQGGLSQTIQLIIAFKKQHENRAIVTTNTLESAVQHRKETVEGVSRIFDDLQQEQHQVVHGIDADIGPTCRFNGAQIDIDIELGGRRA